MADDLPTLVATVLSTISTFVAGLDQRALRDLAAGRQALMLARPGTEPAALPRAPSRGRVKAGAVIDPADVTSHLAGLADRDAAREYVVSLNGTRDDLKALAAGLGVHVLGKDTKPEMIRKIVDRTVGDRLSSRVMRGETVR